MRKVEFTTYYSVVACVNDVCVITFLNKQDRKNTYNEEGERMKKLTADILCLIAGIAIGVSLISAMTGTDPMQLVDSIVSATVQNIHNIILGLVR